MGSGAFTDRDPVVAIDRVLPGYDAALWRKVAGEVRWSFVRPWTWLSGIAVNLVLAALYLVVAPLTGQPHRDWAILVGTYFAVFVLADVTTTNVLGADAQRVRVSLLRGISLLRILVVKNLALWVIVGVPTLLATAVITLNSESGYRLVLTLPGVAFPILTWLGVGNLVSVALPVAAIPLRRRWAQRHDRRATLTWGAHLGLPYLLLLAVDPIGQLPRTLDRWIPAIGRSIDGRGAMLLVVGLSMWVLGTAAALTFAQWREPRL